MYSGIGLISRPCKGAVGNPIEYPCGGWLAAQTESRYGCDAGKAFGFQLRDDQFLPARQGMLDLLRNAFANNWNVSIDYLVPGDHTNNFVLMRAWATKPPANPIVVHHPATP